MINRAILTLEDISNIIYEVNGFCIIPIQDMEKFGYFEPIFTPLDQFYSYLKQTSQITDFYNYYINLRKKN